MNSLHGMQIRISTTLLVNVAFAGVTALIGLAAWLTAVGLQNQLTHLARNREEGMALLQRTGEMHASFQTLQEQATETKEFVDSLRGRLPESPEETAFLQQLSALADGAKVELGDFRPGGVADHKEFKEIELQIHGAGQYAGLCRLLSGLGELPRIMRVSQLTIVAPAEPAGNCAIDLQLHLLFGLNVECPGKASVNP